MFSKAKGQMVNILGLQAVQSLSHLSTLLLESKSNHGQYISE